MCGLLAELKSSGRKGIKRGEQLSFNLHRMSYRGKSTSIVDKYAYFLGHVTLPLDNLDPLIYSQPKRFNKGMGNYAFTGEIFNWRKICEEKGIACQSDCEFIHMVYNKEIEVGFEELDGFWNYVQISTGSIIGLTDYLGQKPLYYRTDSMSLCSEINPLIEEADEFDEIYFSNLRKWGYDPTFRTPWKKIKQLPPGSIYDNGKITEYYDWGRISVPKLTVDNMKNLLIESCLSRLSPDLPISLFLSGGLDSSLIYSIVKYHPNLTTYHTDLGSESEYQYAKMMDPNVELVEQFEPISYDEAVEWNQTPCDLGSVIPQIQLSQTQNNNIVLTGDGADELFGGYRRAKEYDSQHSDIFVELPCYHLPRIDRIMMRATVEVRTPFLNPKMVKMSTRIHPEYRKNKEYLKKIAHCFDIPDEIINRKKQALKTKAVVDSRLANTEMMIKAFRSKYE